MSDNSGHILAEVVGHVGRLTLNRPDKRNAITKDMWGALLASLENWAARGSVRVVLVSSSTEGFFSSGADLAEFERAIEQEYFREQTWEALTGALTALREFPMPTIAAVGGNCSGAGCALALAADLRIVASDAKLSVPPAKLGLVYPLADTARLASLAGPAVAKDMLFTGRRVAAEEAFLLGLVNKVVAPEKLADRARALAAEIAANAPSSLKAAKRIMALVEAGAHTDTKESVDLSLDAYDSGEFAEGLAAFKEKRKPDFG